METIVVLILSAVGIYLLIGVIAYFPLISRGIPSFDDSMHRTPVLFKVLILPGVIALWLPLFLKWRNKKKLQK